MVQLVKKGIQEGETEDHKESYDGQKKEQVEKKDEMERGRREGNNIKEANPEEIQDFSKAMVMIASDVAALYPNLDMDKVA